MHWLSESSKDASCVTIGNCAWLLRQELLTELKTSPLNLHIIRGLAGQDQFCGFERVSQYKGDIVQSLSGTFLRPPFTVLDIGGSVQRAKRNTQNVVW